MREKLKRMRDDVWHGPCHTNADVMICANICANIPDAEIPEIVTFAGLSNGKRTTEKQASLYDAMMAEFMGEKDARLRKFQRTHYVRNDGKPMRKDKRKMYAKEKCYSCDPWHGWDTVRKFREIEAEKADARDYAIELRNIADDAKQFNDWLKYA